MYWGIDGGGTSTRAVMDAGQGRLSEVVTSSASNMLVVGVKQAYRAMDEVLAKLQQIPVDITLAPGVVGLAGADRQGVHKAWQNYFVDRGFARVWIVGDYWLPWAVFTQGNDGIVGVLGTGSVFFGMHRGDAIRLGGYGWKLGDVGSALSIGQQGIKKAIESWEGIEQRTGLVARSLEFFSVSSIPDLIEQLYEPAYPIRQLADFAPRVFETAAQGDRVALALLANEATRIRQILKSYARNLKGIELTVGLSGGLSPLWLPYLKKHVSFRSVRVQFSLVDKPAVYGAVWLAKKWSQEGRNYDTHEL